MCQHILDWTDKNLPLQSIADLKRKKNHLHGTQNFNLVATKKYTRSTSSISSNLTQGKRKEKKKNKKKIHVKNCHLKTYIHKQETTIATVKITPSNVCLFKLNALEASADMPFQTWVMLVGPSGAGATWAEIVWTRRLRKRSGSNSLNFLQNPKYEYMNQRN